MLVDLALNPGPYDVFQNGIDCVTSERINYGFSFGNVVTPPTTAITLNRNALFYQELFDAAPGTQWQTHDPTAGARVGLASGQPLFMSANQSYLSPGAGSSFYRQLCSFAGTDYTALIPFVATANTDTQLAGYVRFTDNANYIRIRYTPATTTWDLLQSVAGVETSLATGSFDLTSNAVAGEHFTIVLLGNQVTVSSPSTVLDGTYTTTHLTGGSLAYLVIATAANVSGFGASPLQETSGTH